MSFVFITGPMKSGKSLELIGRVAPFTFAEKKVLFVQPKKNVRETDITSRLGARAEAVVAESLADIDTSFDVVGVDEVHMFPEEDAAVLREWVVSGKGVFLSGLDLDYRGALMPIVRRVIEMKPDEVIIKQSVCEVCHTYNARFTQILEEGGPLTKGLPPVVPEDGTYRYEARCRSCFKTD